MITCYFLATLFRNAGGETYAYYDADKLKIFVLVRFPLIKLILFADTSSFKMLLNPILLEAKCKLGDAENKIKPFSIGHDASITKFGPYDHIYTKYVSIHAVQTLPLFLHRRLQTAVRCPTPFYILLT